MPQRVSVTAVFENPSGVIGTAVLVVLSKMRGPHHPSVPHPQHPNGQPMTRDQVNHNIFSVHGHQIPDPQSGNHTVVLCVEGWDQGHQNRIAVVGLPSRDHTE
jgi:hypothetical protein